MPEIIIIVFMVSTEKLLCFFRNITANRHVAIYSWLLCAALPTLDINEGALDKVFAIYKQLLPVMGGYLTDAGQLNAGRLEALLQHLALQELETLEQRAAVRTLVLCVNSTYHDIIVTEM